MSLIVLQLEYLGHNGETMRLQGRAGTAAEGFAALIPFTEYGYLGGPTPGAPFEFVLSDGRLMVGTGNEVMEFRP